MRKILEIFEKQVLVFPALVTILACIAFLFGGHCAAWQWWVSVVIVCAFGFRSGRREGFASLGVFVGFLIVLWCVTHTMLTRTPVDIAVYHMPATRALIDGWNPVWTSTPDGVASMLGVTVDDARFWMVVSMAKTAWIFNAVAYFFTGDQMNLFFPVLYFFVTAIALRVWMVFDICSRFVRTLMIAAVFVMAPTYVMTVDVVIAASGIGLMIGFWDVLRGNKPHWLSLVVFSFWMTTAKQLGALHCFLMWVVFSVLYLRSWSRFRQLAVFAATLSALWVVATFAPYITNWKNYGHPFYPCYTVDAERFQTVDLVRDFKEQNEDAARMGPVGRLVNAYISSDLAMAYYSWREGRAYNPQATFYSYDNSASNPKTPTRPWVKLAFCGLFLAVMICGRRPDRNAYLISTVAFCAMPMSMIGYARYTPWMFWSLLPLMAIADGWRCGWIKRLCFLALLVIFVPGLLSAVVNGAQLIDMRFAANRALEDGLVADATPVRHITDDGKLRSVVSLVQATSKYGVSVESKNLKNGRVNFYTDEFQVPKLPAYSYSREMSTCQDRKRRLMMYPKLVFTAALKFMRMLI